MNEKFFNSKRFYSALDSKRISRNITWKKIADETGISPSTLTRMGKGLKPDIESIAALAMWAGINIDDYTPVSRSNSLDTLTTITTALRSDDNLSREGQIAIENMVKSAYPIFRRQDEE